MQNAAYYFAILERQIYFSFKNPIDPYFVGRENLNGKYVSKSAKSREKVITLSLDFAPVLSTSRMKLL